MKKFSRSGFRFFSAVAIALSLAACAAPAPQKLPDPIAFTNVSLRKTEPLFENRERRKPALSLDISMEVSEHAFAPAPAQAPDFSWLDSLIVSRALGKDFSEMPPVAALGKFAAAEVASYKNEWRPLFAELGETASADNFITIRARKNSFLGNDVLVYEISRSEYLGGAHGISTKFFLTVDLTERKQLTLKDVFKPDYAFALTELLVEKAMEKEAVQTREELFVAYRPVPTENFALASDGIIFHYNPYDIAAYSQGPISLKISYEKLRPLLRENVAGKIAAQTAR